MTKPTLDAAKLSLASRAHLLAALKSFGSKAPDQWLPAGHSAANGQLPPDWTSVRLKPDAELVQITAASAPHHCVDGWSYAARAMSALLEGDPHAARHLAYYAQLRAGLCILANLGIGIFNGINFAVTATGTLEQIDHGKKRGAGTHKIVWAALEAWSKDVALSNKFLDLLKVRNASLRDCLTAIWPGFTSAGAVAYLIEGWGIDLARGEREHYHRNTSSYVPQALNPIGRPTIESIQFVEGVWDLFGLGGVSGFDNVDRVLLRSLLQRHHTAMSPPGTAFTAGQIAHRYADLPQQIQNLASQAYLTDAAPMMPELLARAHSTADPANAMEMIARAFLLLRVATGFTHASFTEAGVTCSLGELRPWLDPFAAARGFWPEAKPLADPSDLWIDVQDALIDLGKSKTPPPADLKSWLATPVQGLPVIHQAERIVVWSLSA